MKKIIIIAAGIMAYLAFTLILVSIGIVGVFGLPSAISSLGALFGKLSMLAIGGASIALWYKVTLKLSERYGIDI